MSTETESSAPEAQPVDVSAIVSELADSRGRFPEAALRQCQQHRELVIPHLIRAIEAATATVSAGDELSSDTHWIGLYLLWEFEAKEAVPAILNALTLPGNGAYELFGDIITEDLGNILATLAGDRLELLEALIDDYSVDEYVRSAAMRVFPLLVRDGKISREEGVERLRRHLRTALDRNQIEGTAWLISELCDLNPQEAAQEIREAFDRDLIDEWTISRDEVEQDLAGGADRMTGRMSQLSPTRLDDAVEYLNEFPHFDEAADKSDYDTDDDLDLSPGFAERWKSATRDVVNSYLDDSEAEPPPVTSTIRNEGPRIGRNDPCPCGSGKKYKKCCLRGDQATDVDSLF